MTSEEYHLFQQFLKQSCGIVLGSEKQYLVRSRLTPVLKEFHLKSFKDLLRLLNKPSIQSKRLMIRVIDSMTTNETSWFREKAHFLELEEAILPRLITNQSRKLRVWSAACSTGQEAYSLSICIDQFLKQQPSAITQDIDIIGTDISENAIKVAKQAEYPEMAITRGLGKAARAGFFDQIHGGYKLKTEILNRARFQQFNLLKPMTVLGQFDIIFCRNVFIYFSEQIKKDILRRMAEILKPKGVLFLGRTEAMPSDLKAFQVIDGHHCQYYQKTD